MSDKATARLVSITFRGGVQLPLVGPRENERYGVDEVNALKGWTISIRGAAVFLVSPRGWVHKGHPLTDSREQHVFELPRSDVKLHWASDDALTAIDKQVQRYDSPEFGLKPTEEKAA